MPDDRRSGPPERRDPGRTEFDVLQADQDETKRWREETDAWRHAVTRKLEVVAAQGDRLAVANKRNSEGLEIALRELKFNSQTTQRIEASTSDLVVIAKNLDGFANTCIWFAKWIAAPVSLLALVASAFGWVSKNWPTL